MKIIIKNDSITIYLSKQNEQTADEVKAPQTPSLNDTSAQYEFRPLSSFSPIYEAKIGAHGNTGNKNAATTHHCSRCGTAGRKFRHAKGGCKVCVGKSNMWCMQNRIGV